MGAESATATRSTSKQATMPAKHSVQTSSAPQTSSRERMFAASGGTAVPKSFAGIPPLAPQQKNTAVSSTRYGRGLRMQCKLTIGAVNDPLEAEADAVADLVVRGQHTPTTYSGAPAAVNRKCSCEGLEHSCAACEEDKNKLQHKAASALTSMEAPPIVHDVLNSPGQPLDSATRGFFESRFGHDFSSVRVHTDTTAAESTQAVNALAYTVGQHVIFGPGRYSPATQGGRKLLAHELTHVVQQEGVPTLIQRACGPGAIGHPTGCIPLQGDLTGEPFLFRVRCDEFRRPPDHPIDQEARLRAFARTLQASDFVSIHGFASEEGDARFNEDLSCARAVRAASVLTSEAPSLTQIQKFKHGAAPGNRDDRRSVIVDLTPAPSTPQPEVQPPAADPSCARNPECPADYCRPFATRQEAINNRSANAETVLSRIATANGRARPLFERFVFNPGPAGDISAEYATDFSRDLVTRAVTERLVAMLREEFTRTPPVFPPGSDHVTVDIYTVLNRDTVNSFLDREMVFSDPFTIPGLIAGGVGTTQETCRVGANTTGAVNDSRRVEGSIQVIRTSDGSLILTPEFTFTVVDTIDFCPGNCGGSVAQVLTVPLSRWEASGISGDVPFTVRFAGPSLVGAYDSED